MTIRGFAVCYVLALVNSGFAVAQAYGLHMTATQQGATMSFVNACLVVVAHLVNRNGNAKAAG